MPNDYAVKSKGIIKTSSTGIYPSIEALFGPWNSFEEFRTYLGSIILKTVTDNDIPNGLKIGIKQSDTTVKEYKWTNPSNAEASWVLCNAVESVNGKTGAVTLSKSDIGLGNVENTTDANKNVNSAVKDGSGNNIASTYETKTDAQAKINALTKTSVGLGNVDNTADANKVVKGANEDGSGNVISTTYETKADATTKQTGLQTAIAAIQSVVENLVGLEGTNFAGFSVDTTEADALAAIPTKYTTDGYTNELVWYLVGDGIDNLKAYSYDGTNTPVLVSSKVYDFTDFSGIAADVSTLRQDLDALGPKIGGKWSNSYTATANSWSSAIPVDIASGSAIKVKITTSASIYRVIIGANGTSTTDRIYDSSTISPQITSFEHVVTADRDIENLYIRIDSSTSSISTTYSLFTGVQKDIDDSTVIPNGSISLEKISSSAFDANPTNGSSKLPTSGQVYDVAKTASIAGYFNINRYLAQNTAFSSKNTARLSVPSALRFHGMTITYLYSDSYTNGWIVETYQHSSRLDDSYWEMNSNWKPINETILNISEMFPTGGIDDSNVFRRGNARGFVSSSARKAGTIITYLSQDGWRIEQFVGSDWSTDDDSWVLIGGTQPSVDGNLTKLVGSITNNSSTIQWTDGYFRNVKGKTGTSGAYRISNEIQFKKGDMLIIRLSTAIDATIPCIFKSYDGASPYHPVMWGGQLEYRYVANEDCYVTLNAFQESRDSEQQFIILRSGIANDYFTNEEYGGIYPAKKILPYLANLKKVPTQGNDTYTTPITLLHFSDLHSHYENYERIIRFKDKFQKYLGQTYIDDAIHSGDLAGQNYQIFDDRLLDADNKILQVIGNHDTYKYYVTFTCSGIMVSPSVGDVYVLDAIEYTVVEVSLSSGAGTIKCKQSGGNISVTSGTLTKSEGNGDSSITFSAASESAATSKDCYERYMSNIANWNVTQPSDAATYGKNYYYKDYTESNATVLRLVVIDCMYWTEAQAEWLEDVLDDALTNEIPVIASQHFPLHNSATVVNKIICPFSSQQDEKFYRNDEILWNGSVEIVDDFIEAGGQFVCWLTGHMHFDFIYWLKDYPSQLWLSVASAGGDITWADRAWVYDTEAFDLFNVVGVDVHNKWLKVVRFGCKLNIALQKAECITLDWGSYDDFDDNTTYKVGQICMHNGNLYKFKFLHPAGSWSSEDVERYNRIVE